MTTIEGEKLVMFFQAFREKPVALEKLLAFVTNKPITGSITIKVRDGRIHGIEEIRQTY